jgi:hypothetical protein
VPDAALLISIIGGLFVIVQVLVAYIFRNAVGDLKERLAEQRIQFDTRLAEQCAQLGSRCDRQDVRFEKYVRDKDEFDYKFRHNELAPRLIEWQDRLSKVEEIKDRVEQLWNRIYNGNSHK